MTQIQNLCCYCSASDALAAHHFEAAAQLGQQAAQKSLGIVYGAGGTGLMGAVARAALQAGGQVIGVIPKQLEALEVGLREISQYIVVEDMHVRKRVLAERADAFCILPGGIGTLEEMFEAVTWRYLTLHDKPIVIFNDQGFWDPLLSLINHLYQTKALRKEPSQLFSVARTPAEVFEQLGV